MNNVPLQDLIDAGADAAPNLFYITVDKEISSNTDSNNTRLAPPCRVQNVSLPTVNQSTTQIPWQNTQVIVCTPGSSSLTKDIAFTFRIDSNYTLYNELLKSVDVDVNGEVKTTSNVYTYEDENTTAYQPVYFTIWVYALTPSSTENDQWGYNKPQAIWKFSHCKIYKIPRIDLSYGNSNPLTVNVSFIYETVNFFNYDVSQSGVFDFKYSNIIVNTGINNKINDTVSDIKEKFTNNSGFSFNVFS